MRTKPEHISLAARRVLAGMKIGGVESPPPESFNFDLERPDARSQLVDKDGKMVSGVERSAIGIIGPKHLNDIGISDWIRRRGGEHEDEVEFLP